MITHVDDLYDDAPVEYKNNVYQYIGPCKMKCPETGDWKPAIQYFDGRSEETYIREVSDFLSKFTIKPE